MNTHMTIEEYKKRAWDYLQKTYGDTIKEVSKEAMEESFRSLGMKTDADWELYMKDFSPEVLVQGRLSGLI